MAFQTHAKTIDGFSVEVSQLTGMKALRMTTRLGKFLSAPLAKALSGVDASNMGNVDLSVIAGGLSAVFENIGEDEIERLARDLLGNARLNGAEFLNVCDVALSGRPDVFLRCLLFAVEVNYKPFFDVLRGLGRRATAQTATPSQPPKS